MREHFFREAINSMNATRPTLLAARLFGKREKRRDGYGHEVTLSHWRGTTYLINWKEAK